MFYRRRLPHWQPEGRSVFVTFRLFGSFPPSPDGPRWLAREDVARMVVDSLLHGHGKNYDLFAYVVMPNHVHLLLYPEVELKVLLASLKGFTARRGNRLVGRDGHFW